MLNSTRAKDNKVMGFKMRKSIKIVPGVRLNVSAKSIGISAGVRGARVSVNSRRGVTKTIGVPGTGIAYSSTSNRSQGATRSRSTVPVSPPPASSVKPGMLAPAWEKAVYRVLVAPQITAPELHALVPLSPEAARIASLFEVIRVSLPQRDFDRARALTEWLCAVNYDPSADATLLKYRARADMHLPIADGVAADVTVDRQTLGLLLAELEQNAGNVDRAIEVVEALEPTTLAAVSLAELYGQMGRWSDVVDLTNGVTNVDDLTVYLLTQRAVAFRELGHFGAARESFKEALRSRSRSKELLNVALVERGRAALAEGKKAAARKDFERVLASDGSYPEIRELLNEAG
jgi:hypothetical protein